MYLNTLPMFCVSFTTTDGACIIIDGIYAPDTATAIILAVKKVLDVTGRSPAIESLTINQP